MTPPSLTVATVPPLQAAGGHLQRPSSGGVAERGSRFTKARVPLITGFLGPETTNSTVIANIAGPADNALASKLVADWFIADSNGLPAALSGAGLSGIKILSGYHRPDPGGEVSIAGRRLELFGSPASSSSLGCRWTVLSLLASATLSGIAGVFYASQSGPSLTFGNALLLPPSRPRSRLNPAEAGQVERLGLDAGRLRAHHWREGHAVDHRSPMAERHVQRDRAHRRRGIRRGASRSPSAGSTTAVAPSLAQDGDARSHETPVDVAPSPARSWCQMAGDWVVGLLVVRLGVLLR
jgi:hypothetical protein